MTKIKVDDSDFLSNFTKEMVGKDCCRKRVGSFKSISLGFGEKVFHGKSNFADPFYGEWEINAYTAGWRIVRDGVIVSGSRDLFEPDYEHDSALQLIRLGKVMSINVEPGKYDAVVNFERNTSIEFVKLACGCSELFNVFSPSGEVLSYYGNGVFEVEPCSRKYA